MPHISPSHPDTRRPATATQARTLRRRATLTERTLWMLLRDRRLSGLKFRRQLPVGPYVLDFVCLSRRLVIEADGPFHDTAHDALRDQWLATQDFRVLRFTNGEIQSDAHGVLEKIRSALPQSGEKSLSSRRRNWQPKADG